MSREAVPTDVAFDGWHHLTAAEVAARLELDPLIGLATIEAASRLIARGANRLPRAKQRSSLRVFIDQFRGFLVAVLVGAAALASIGR